MPALIPFLAIIAMGLSVVHAAKSNVPLWPAVFVASVALLLMTWR